MKKLATLSLAALLLSSTAVLAQNVQTTFDGLDADGDGKLSFSDLLPEWPDLTQDQFDAADIDGDDFLDITQFEALQAGAGGSSSVEIAAGTMTPAIDAPLFENLDSDGNGKLSFDDLTGLGISQDQFDTADIDGDDFLDATQYEGLKSQLVSPSSDVAVDVTGGSSAIGLPLFEDVDADGDGQIAFSDLKIALPDVTQEQFDAADIDGDDFLDRTQYEGMAM